MNIRLNIQSPESQNSATSMRTTGKNGRVSFVCYIIGDEYYYMINTIQEDYIISLIIKFLRITVEMIKISNE